MKPFRTPSDRLPSHGSLPQGSLPRTQQGRPTWQAALLVFLSLATPAWVVLTLADWLLF